MPNIPQIKIGNVTYDMKDKRVDHLRKATGVDLYSFIPNGYINTNVAVGAVVSMDPQGYGASEYQHVIAQCSEGDMFMVCAYGGNAPRTWAFVDQNNRLISKSNVDVQLDGSMGIIAPANSAKIIVNNSHSEYDHYVFKGMPIENQLDSVSKQVSDLQDASMRYKAEIVENTPIQYKWLAKDEGVKNIDQSYGDWYVASDIPIEPNTYYYITGSAQYNEHSVYQICSLNGTILEQNSATSSETLALSDELILTPPNASTIRIASIFGRGGIGIYLARCGKKWSDKKWVCIGDSLTGVNIRTTKHYYDYVSDKTGINIVELGEGGTGYKRSYAGDGPFIDRVDSIPLDADVVTIFGSGNDAIYTIGSPSDTGTDSLCSAINATIEAIFSRIPTCQLGIVTPTPWDAYNPSDESNWMAQYSEAIVSICKRWGIPCLDLYHCSNLRPWDAEFRAAAYSKDDGNGVHPDETGHKIIASRFESFLDTLLLH